MGQRITSIFQRDQENVQEVDIGSSNAYRWPPKTGNYFGSHFIMGGERFDSQQPEAFLFGENSDLNFLGSRPVPFPYAQPQLNEPTRTLRSLINIRKDTVRLVRCDQSAKEHSTSTDDKGAGDAKTELTKGSSASPQKSTAAAEVDVEAGAAAKEAEASEDVSYNIEFTFDSDVTCRITVMYFAKEEMGNGAVTYTPRDGKMSSETVTYKKGAKQVFTQATHIIEPFKFSEDEWAFDVDAEEIPIVIHCVVDRESEHGGHSHMTFCALEKLNDNSYTLKVIKQKQYVDGVLYMLQEFYGIENKENDTAKSGDDDDLEENNAECVICMSDMRDTMILPCRHLCLCKTCADSLRFQASNCPICRAPFRALLQMRAIRRKVAKPEGENATASDDEEELGVSQKDVPAGYEAVSLIEALNGPCFYNARSAEPRQRLSSSQSSVRRSKKKKKDGKGSRILRDKDKDAIADEEKERSTATPDASDVTRDGSKDTDDNVTAGATDTDADHGDSKDDVTDLDERKGATGDAASPSSKDKAMKKKLSVHSDDPASETAVTGVTADTSHTLNVEDEDGPIAELPGDISGSDDDDTFALSSRTQTTTLPGTPDHVLDELSDSETADTK